MTVPPDEDPIAEEAYEELADEYDREVETNPYNADFEVPATRSLVPAVDGKRIPDVRKSQRDFRSPSEIGDF